MKKHLAVLALLLLTALGVSAQCTVTGQVTDEKGEPLPGANVFITGARKGGVADAAGLYRIENVPPGTHTLQASYVGYETVRKPTVIKEGVQRLIVHLQLEERVVQIDELIVRATRATEKTPIAANPSR